MVQAHLLTRLMALGMAVLTPSGACGQDFPSKPIRVMTGAIDAQTRILGEGLSKLLGQQVIFESRPTGSLSAEVMVQRAAPDGYTLLLAGSSFWIGPLLKDMPYGATSEFAPITLTARAPNILVVHPALPVKSVKELIALAKSRPGELNYSAGGVGASPHMAAELFNSMAGLKIVRIPFSNGELRVSALIRGDVQLEFSPATLAKAYMQSGRLKGLAVTTAQPSALAPDLPTVGAAGLPGYQWDTSGGLFAPAKTPQAIVTRLNQDTVRLLHTVDAKEKFMVAGTEAVGTSPEEFAAIIKTQVATATKVIKAAGIRLE